MGVFKSISEHLFKKMSFFYSRIVTFGDYNESEVMKMQENAIRAELEDVILSAVLFDEAFRLSNKSLSSPLPEAPHCHADYEIFFLLSGELTLRGEKESITAKAPVTVVVPPLTNHITEAKNLQGYCMYFNLKKDPKVRGSLYEGVSAALQNKISLLPMKEETRFYVTQLEKYSSSHLQETHRHLIYLLFENLFESVTPPKVPQELPKNQQYINRIDLFLSEHYREKIRLEHLAELLHLCPKQVSRIIYRKYGCSFTERIRDFRMALARTMLTDSDQTVEQIALTAGYENPTYFYAQFRKTHGMTPLEYRAKNRKTES